jgi:hypothetical protein
MPSDDAMMMMHLDSDSESFTPGYDQAKTYIHVYLTAATAVAVPLVSKFKFHDADIGLP